MPERIVRGVAIYYDIFGDTGPWIALTPGSRRAFNELVPIANMLAEHGCRVLLHDRRNCGRSEVGIDGSASEHEVWADDLYELCQQLDAVPLYVGGSSAGARLALLFGLRHPDAVRGLLLWRVTGGQHAAKKLAHKYYRAFADLAQSGGMAAVCDSEHFSACIRQRPANRDRLMAMNPADFIDVMNVWEKNFLAAADLPVVGATEEQLRGLASPACIISGNDKVHTPETAATVASLIPQSELHEDVVERRDANNLLDEWDQKEWKSVEGRLVSIFDEFLKRNEPGLRR